MRSPRRLWRESGIRGVVALNLLVGGNVLSALAAPILLAELAIYLAAHALAATPPARLFTGALIELHVTAITAGYLATTVVSLMGLARRGHLRSGWVLALTPVYWILLSIAAWRALYQLFAEPYRWEKTEHGGARPRAARRHAGKARVMDLATPLAAPARVPQPHRYR